MTEQIIINLPNGVTKADTFNLLATKNRYNPEKLEVVTEELGSDELANARLEELKLTEDFRGFIKADRIGEGATRISYNIATDNPESSEDFGKRKLIELLMNEYLEAKKELVLTQKKEEINQQLADAEKVLTDEKEKLQAEVIID